ncbi:hypothetical protein [Kordia sp.]|uniref:hypothetical protein n=1 Tax=Kordia sp. TaxID=1965332 RepID=UPI003D29F45C
MKTIIDNFFFKSNEKFLNRNNIIIVIGVFCIINLLIISPDIYEIFASDGLVDASINNSFLTFYQPRLAWFTNPLMHIGIPEKAVILAILAFYLVSLMSVLSKYKPVLFSIIAWFIHITLVNSSYLFSYGADYFISFLLFFNIFLNISTVIQEDKGNALYSFIVRFMQLHLCIVYFFAGFGKILGTDWLDGNAMWYVLNSFMPESVDTMLNFIEYPIVFQVLSWAVLLELVYPLLIFMPKVRKWFLIKIFFLHIGIAIIMQFYTFGMIMILLNIVAFGHYINWKSIAKMFRINGLLLKEKKLA